MAVDPVNDFVYYEQRLEGQRIADWQWGTTQAKQIVVRGIFTNNWTGSFNRCVWLSIRNAALNRSYVAELYNFRVGSGTVQNSVPFSIVIPGCTDGVWAKDNTLGAILNISLFGGTAYQTTTPNTWLSLNKTVTDTSTQLSSGLGTTQTKIGSVGIYLDPYKTGVAPPFVIPQNIAMEIKRCQRYWYPAFGLSGGVSSGTVVSRAGLRHPVPMRTTPSGTLRGTNNFHDGVVSPAASSLATVCNAYAAEFDVTTGGTFATVGKAAAHYYSALTNYIEMNARM